MKYKYKLKNKILYYLLIILILLNYGCARRYAYTREFTSQQEIHLINEVPFYKQSTNTCGPASLASVLDYWGIDFDRASILQSVYSPEPAGSLDFEMSYYARKLNLWSKYYQASFEDLKEKIKKDIPLIVIEREGLRRKNYHYIVVFGFDDRERRIIAHTGRESAVWIPYSRFLRMWGKADFGTIVICPPEKVYWRLSPAGYIYLGYLLENKNSLDKAKDVYLKAIAIEPESKVAHFNLGNVYFKMNLFSLAEGAFRKAIQIDGDFADAYNNLACVYLSESRNLAQAEALVKKALSLNPEGRDYYLDTLKRIKQKLEVRND